MTILTFSFEGWDHSQYYSGHGHAHEKDLIACLFVQVPITEPLTYRQLREQFMTESRGVEWYIEDEQSFKDPTDEDLNAAIIEEFGEYPHVLVDGPYNYTEEENTDFEDLYFYGYFHTYKENTPTYINTEGEGYTENLDK